MVLNHHHHDADNPQHENKKIQMKLDKAQAQLAKISMDASLLGRPQGMVLLNPISGGRTHPEAVSLGLPDEVERARRNTSS